jgi:hypothetical protein
MAEGNIPKQFLKWISGAVIGRSNLSWCHPCCCISGFGKTKEKIDAGKILMITIPAVEEGP